jgi:hypothetical protein
MKTYLINESQLAGIIATESALAFSKNIIQLAKLLYDENETEIENAKKFTWYALELAKNIKDGNEKALTIFTAGVENLEEKMQMVLVEKEV